MENGVKQSILAPPVGGAVGGTKTLLFSPISELTTQTNCRLDIIGPIYVPSINLISGFVSCKTNMFRPELTYDQNISRVSAAKTIIKNVENYTTGVSYGDSQRFSFEDNGTIYFYHKSEKEKIPSTVLVWSCMSTINSTISRVDGRLDSAKYRKLLEEHVLPLAPQTTSHMIKYVHDWFPVHYSTAMKKYYSEHKNALILLDWPRCFGDVMPVESLWKQMLNELTEKKTLKFLVRNNYGKKFTKFGTKSAVQSLCYVV
ncbi:hypothetical protein DAPPUDRAFT_322893 [Daphnia pulex]|uniref:DDE-1 domain-containing protein n=1 Tax=Daphnia pulex TaxID=6669 RepID=E9GX87_DAPPU|nr:hypothetical protein DAPPUDRAFT_322893 [Daphnia pulex]|eukprot:EFX75828.1 hypothetical protein DAPPUDRAFT_322893 [Daphnia pulex]